MSGLIDSVGSRSGIIGSTEIPGGYEEGAWTPQFHATGGESSQVYDDQQGTYVKIGKWVNCQFFIDMNTEGTFTGNITLNLPFATSPNSFPTIGNGGPFYWQDSGGSFIYFTLQMGASTTRAYLWSKSSSTTSREYPGATDLSDTTIMSGTFGYYIA